MGNITYSRLRASILNGGDAVDAAARINALALLGYYPRGSAGQVLRINGNSDLDTLLGGGELRRVVEDIYNETEDSTVAIDIIFAANDATGDNDTVTHTGTGTATTAVTGKANWFVRPKILIVTGGANGTATCKVSLDDGETYGAEQTIAESGALVLAADLGLTITFTTGGEPAKVLVAGDTYSWLVKANSLTLGDAATAGSIIRSIRDYLAAETLAVLPEIIHICGAVAEAGVDDLNDIAEEYLEQWAPLLITHEFRRPDEFDSETHEEYFDAAQAYFADAAVSGQKYTGVLMGFNTAADYNGCKIDRSSAGIIYGRMLKLAKISDSNGVTQVGSDTHRVRTTVYGLQFTDVETETLNELGASMLRKHAGQRRYYYCTRQGTNAGSTSAYQCLDRVRVMIYAVGLVFAKLFPLIDVDLGEGDTEPKALSALLTAHMGTEVGAYVADYAVLVSEDGDSFVAEIELVHKRKASDITANLSMKARLTIPRR